jgi:hypothetical protein
VTLKIFCSNLRSTQSTGTIFYASSDTYTDTVGGLNIVVNIRSNFYPGDGVGKPQPSDLISTKVGDKDPMFKSYDGKIATPNGATTSNDFHHNAGSPALGKGNSTYNSDLGAYTSDGKGNKH